MGGAAAGRRGTAYERDLVNYLRRDGYGALRFPASGSATTRSVPDVMAADPREDGGTDLWGIELKSGKATTLYVEGGEVRKLQAFAQRWGATIYLGARPTTRGTGKEHYLIRPEDARETDGGRYGLPRSELDDRASIIVGPEGVA